MSETTFTCLHCGASGLRPPHDCPGSQPDPRDARKDCFACTAFIARIAELEAALREARGYVLAYDHCDEAGEVLRQSLIARIAALLAKPGAG